MTIEINKLLKLMKGLDLFSGDGSFIIQYIQSDSRKTNEDDIFCLYDDFQDQTLKFVQSTSAKTILINKNNPFKNEIKNKNIIISDKNPQYYHGIIASTLTGNPSEKLKLVCVTGTNGKTSTTHILSHLFYSQKIKTGIIGTLYAKYSDTVIETGYTTPEPSLLNKILKEMFDHGVEYVFMEASSHGISLGRINGLKIEGVIFTNLTQDHLDFHSSMEEYFQSKFKLFSLMEEQNPEGVAVLFSDDPYTPKIQQELKEKKSPIKIITVGTTNDSMVKIIDRSSSLGTFFELQLNENIIPIQTNLQGIFNIINSSLSIILGMTLKLDLNQLILSCLNIPQIPGRFEVFQNKLKTKTVVVDYAHTPDALENILIGIKKKEPSSIITLFGCGGNRDPIKRPLMGKIAEKYSDFVIVTSDNPRNEEPMKIIQEIVSGFSQSFSNFLIEEDRRIAIEKGIRKLSQGAYLLVAGKGHETVQIIGEKKNYFSDSEEIKKTLVNY